MDTLFPNDSPNGLTGARPVRFRALNPVGLNDCVFRMSEIYNAELLKSYLSDVLPLLDGRCCVDDGRHSVPIERYLPAKKIYAFTKREAALFCALVHDNPDNLRQVLALLPSWYSEAALLMIRDGFVSRRTLSRLGAASMLVTDDRYSWHRYHPGKYSSIFLACASLQDLPEAESYWETEGYLKIPNKLQEVYAEALQLDISEESLFLRDSASYPVCNAEQAFHQSLPIILGLQRQQSVPVNPKLKLSCSAAKKLQASIPDIVPEKLHGITRVCAGQYYLPGLLWSMQKSRKRPADYVSAALDYLLQAGPDRLYPAFLPHIKGFRANQFRYVPHVPWMSVLCEYLERYPDSWISLSGLADYLHIHGEGGYTLRSDVLRELFLQNTISGENIRPSTQGREIDLEILRAMVVILYGWGMAELAVVQPYEIPDSPCACVKQVHLTAFGRYVLGIDKSYKAPATVSEKAFSLDADRLIIHTLGENNPYERLLLDTAEPIGRGKYRMTAETFLKHCGTANDVEEKVKFFEDYIDGNPPEVWKGFFQEIRRRCKPLAKVKEEYYLLQLKPEDTELIELMASDSAIRKLIILAEGYRFLVPRKDYAALTALLKQHSYLL